MKRIDKLRRFALSEGGLPLLWLALTVVVLVPVWSQRLLPMLDTPNHLALVRGWHSFYDDSYKIAEYYDLRIRVVPYFLFYSAIHLLMYVFSIEVANKLFLSAYLVLFPLSILAVARALRRSPWLALSGFPLAFNQNWIYGFSSYLMGTVFMFFALAALIFYLRDGLRGHLVVLGVTTVLAYLGHVLPWFVFGCSAIALLVLHRRRWQLGLRAALAMLPSVALACVAVIGERSDKAYLKSDEFVAAFRDFPTAVIEFERRVMELFPGNLDLVVFLVIAVTALGFVWWRGTRVAGADPVEDKQLPLLIILWGVIYISLPYSIAKPMSWWYVSPRIPSLMAPLLCLLPAGRFIGWQRALFAPLVAATVALPLQLARLYTGFSRRNAPFMRLCAEVPRGTKVLVVVRGMMRGPLSEEKSGDPATSAPVYWHFSSWPMALNGGYGPYVFNQGIPIRPKVGVTVTAPAWGAVDTFDIRQAHDFDYFIVRNAADQMDREPSLSLVDRAGDWTLYKVIVRLTDEP
jgi:hypothetical protein